MLMYFSIISYVFIDFYSYFLFITYKIITNYA